MATKCQLTDDLIAWYVHKQRLDQCLSLIKKNVYVDRWCVKNRILEYDAMCTNWHPVPNPETFFQDNVTDRFFCEGWSLGNARGWYIGSWVVDQITYETGGEIKTQYLNYRDDPRTAESYLPTFYSGDSR